MNKFAHSKKWLFFALITISLALSACTAAASHEWLEAPDWGRARLIGSTESAYPVLPAVDEAGNLYFAFAHIEANVPIIVVSAYDESLNLRWEQEIMLERLNRANRPSIALSNKGIEAFWILNGSLYSANLSTDGELLGAPQRISGSRAVSHYSVAVTAQNERILWFSGDRSEPGLFFVDPAGNIISADRDGYRPEIVINPAGGMHVSWLRNERGSVNYDFVYAYYPDNRFVENQEEVVFSLTLSITAGLTGPELGADQQNVYVYWSEIARTGLAAGQVDSFYTSMPIGGSAMGSPQALTFPFGYNLNYSEYENYFLTGERALPEQQSAFAAPVVIESFANPVQRSEVAVGVKANIPFLRNQRNPQAGITYLSDGEITSFQLLSFTPGNSEFATIQADEQAYAHFTWLEQSQTDEYRVYYSSTRPQSKSVLDDLGQEDAYRLAGDTLFGLLSGMVLIPFPLFWGIGPVLIFFFTGFLRKENEPITAPATLFTLLISLVVYSYAKLFTMPSIATYVPFSAWIPILPFAWYDALRIGTPILVSLFAIFMAWRATYARNNPAPLFFIFNFIAWDGLLTIALYGVTFFGGA